MYCVFICLVLLTVIVVICNIDSSKGLKKYIIFKLRYRNQWIISLWQRRVFFLSVACSVWSVDGPQTQAAKNTNPLSARIKYFTSNGMTKSNMPSNALPIREFKQS